MAIDAHKNFAISAVATAPSPATSGTSLVVTTGHGTRFPAVPFNATIWPTASTPDPSTAEIVRVTAISTDTFTITRTQESTSARTVVVGDQIMAGITAKTLTDVEGWNILTVATEESRINTSTLANSTALQFEMEASAKYRIRGFLFWDTTASADTKYALAGPASPTKVRFSRYDGRPALAAVFRAGDVAYPGATSIVTTTGDCAQAHFDGVVHNGSNSGTFAVQFAQDSAVNDAGCRLLVGSYLEYKIVT